MATVCGGVELETGRCQEKFLQQKNLHSSSADRVDIARNSPQSTFHVETAHHISALVFKDAFAAHLSKCRDNAKRLEADHARTGRENSWQRQWDILGFYAIFSFLPEDLQLMVLTYLDPLTFARIKVTRIADPCNRLSLQTLDYTQNIVDDLLTGGYQPWLPNHLSVQILDHQFGLEKRVFPVDFLPCLNDLRPVPSTPLTNRTNWDDHRDEKLAFAQIEKFHTLHTIADLAVGSIQHAFPCMRQTGMLRLGLTLLMQFSSPTPDSASEQRRWDYVASLSAGDKMAIRKFLDSLVEVVAQHHPFEYHRTCADPYCAKRERDPPSFIKRCPCCQQLMRDFSLPCPWRLPDRMIDELDTLGITQVLVRQFVVRKVHEMLHDIFEASLGSDPLDRTQFQDYWVAEDARSFWYGPKCGDVGVKLHRPNSAGQMIMYLHQWWLPVVFVSGTKTCGTIHLKKNPLQSTVGGLALKLDQALFDVNSKTPLDLQAWDHAVVARDGILVEYDRCMEPDLEQPWTV